MASPAITASTLGRLTAAVALTVPVWTIQGRPQAYLTAAAPQLQNTPALSGKSQAALTTTPAAMAADIHLGSVRSYLMVSSRARITNSTIGLTVWDAALDVYGLFKIEVKSPLALDLARNRILGAINAIMQQIWSRADQLNYFNQEQVTVTVTNGNRTVVLDSEIQQVIGPVSKTGGNDLRPIPSHEALRSYVDYWYGGAPPAVQPTAYFLDCDQDVSLGGRTKITLTLPWATTADYNLEMLVVKAVPRYTESDISAATPIRLPAKYVELLFLPLLREWASTDHLFKSEAARPAIAAAAQQARAVLGLIEPDQAVVKKTKEGQTP